MNRAILVGNLTRDPEVRVLNSGVSVCSFTVAVNRRFANQQGEREADFIPVVVWRAQAESCARYLRKGSKVAVCGTIQTRSYDAQDGTKRYVTEVVADEVQFLDSRSGAADMDAPAAPAYSAPAQPAKPAPVKPGEDLQTIEEDDLPF